MAIVLKPPVPAVEEVRVPRVVAVYAENVVVARGVETRELDTQVVRQRNIEGLPAFGGGRAGYHVQRENVG